jgi:hypothetical protein
MPSDYRCSTQMLQGALKIKDDKSTRSNSVTTVDLTRGHSTQLFSPGAWYQSSLSQKAGELNSKSISNFSDVIFRVIPRSSFGSVL